MLSSLSSIRKWSELSDARTPLKLNGKQQQQTTTTTTTLRIKLLPTTIPLPYQPSPLSKKKRKKRKEKEKSYYIIPRKRKFLGKKRREHRLKSDSILATEHALLLPSSSQRGLNVTAVHGRRRRRAAKEARRERGQFLFIASYKYGIN